MRNAKNDFWLYDLFLIDLAIELHERKVVWLWQRVGKQMWWFGWKTNPERKHQTILTMTNNKHKMYTLKNFTVSLKDFLTYGKLMKGIDKEAVEM